MVNAVMTFGTINKIEVPSVTHTIENTKPRIGTLLFDNLLKLIEIRNVPIYAAPFTRFKGTVEEHTSVVLIDPANNLLEFKHYLDPRMMY